MIPNCGILTESIKELGKKHGITNEVYLKALYTRWATMHTNDEVFDDKALLEEMSLDAKKVDTIHLKEFGVIPSYTPISGEAPGGKISGVNKEGNIKLYKDSITGIEDFLKYISGKTSDSITSQQKKKVFEKLSKEGKDLRYFEDLLKSKKDILAFVLFHEKSHIAHRDIENYDVQDLLGDNQIEIEYRATLDAIEEFKAWKENESKKSVTKPDERFGNVTFTTTQYNDYPTRTTENANWSDITLALATNFTTAGETLTAQKAGSKDSEYLFGREALNVKDKYVPYKLDGSSPKDIASKILETINAKGLPTKNIKLNIAGNGIYTLKESQDYYDNLVTEIIRELQNLGVTIAEIRSGGQTGIDEAGIKAAQRLNIPASVHTTANWMFKDKDSNTITNEESFKKRFEIKKKAPKPEEKYVNLDPSKKTEFGLLTSEGEYLLSQTFDRQKFNEGTTAVRLYPTTAGVGLRIDFTSPRTGNKAHVIYTGGSRKIFDLYFEEGNAATNINDSSYWDAIDKIVPKEIKELVESGEYLKLYETALQKDSNGVILKTGLEDYFERNFNVLQEGNNSKYNLNQIKKALDVKNQIFDSEGNIRWDYFERILDAYLNNQPDSMFAKGRYTLATRPENHFEGEKNTLNHIKFVTQSMLDLFEGKFDVDLPFVSEARASLKNQRDLMILAAMFHDVAKPYRHGDIHGWEAADIVRDVLGVDYNNRIAEWAVRHHMPMPFSHKAEFSLANPEALEVAKNIARDARRLGIDAQTAINAFVLINAADVINGRELSVEDNWAKKAAAEGKTRYGDDISVKNVLTVELNEKVELLKQAFEEIKDEDLGDSKYNYENQERFDYIAFPEGGREDKKLPYLKNRREQTRFNYDRYSDNAYEVSSAGDSRFSALYATFANETIIDGVDVGGKTIEWVYQNVIKKSGKGKAPSKDSKLFIPSREGYKGDITPSEDTIFVFGSNPEGRHGAGAAKVAKDKFGAQYGVGEGLTGNAYALPTKDLRVKENKGLRSISKESIIESIKTLYKVATENPGKQFKVAYRNKLDETTLNGYTGEEMIDMFLSAGPIPSNIIFSEEWVNTGKFNLSKQEIEDFSYEKGYLPLWQEWARQNPELIEDLRTKASGKTLTDKFASTAVSQARALADILNSSTQPLEQPTQQLEELPEDIIIKPSPVSADEVTKRDLNTPRAKLNNILPANIQTKRSKLIAKMFYDICNEHIEAKKQEYLDKGDYQTVLEWDSSAVGRAKALRYIDVKSVLEEVYQSFIDNANVTIEEMVNDWRLPLEVAEHRKKHYTIIVDNFAALLEDACPQIEKDCGLRLCITANQVNNGKIKETKLSGTFIRPEDIYDTDPNMQDNEDGARSNGNDGWSYKARHTDPHSTISLATKNILRQLPRKDSNGDIIYDDLGNEELIDEEFAHTMLIQGLSGMITSEDFCVITQTENGPEYDFPALQQLALKYPWVEEVIDYLINNPTEIAAFYTDFRNTFIPYYKFKNGKLVAMNQGTTNGSSLILQVKRDYEQGNPLTDNPIYTTMSESNVENIEINKELLKEIQDDLTYTDSEDSESLKPILEKTVKLIRALGFDVDYNDINALWHTGSNNSVFNNVLSSVSTILSKAANAEPSGLITMLNSDYIEIAKNISKVSDLENLASFREGDKTYYSYSAPNFADIQIAYFKSDKYRDDYLTENFKQFKWFIDNEGNLRNGWLKLLATDDYVRQNLETIELKNIDGVDYEDWTGDMIDKAFIGAYFSKYGGDSAVKFAYYHYPIFSDSPVAKFIKMPRHSNTKDIIPLLREVVKQELYRIDHVNKRANTKGISKIGNYDKVGRKFCFFPDLNDYKVGDKSFLDACNEQYANEAKQNEIIDSALEAIMERNFLKFKQDTAITAQDLKNWGVDDLTVEEALKEYYYNSVYAETQIIQMTVTDLAYYKDATDFQKRFKEVYAAGKRLYTGSQYGKKFENVIYLADNVKTSTAYDRFKKGLNKALEAGRITKMDYDSILYKFRNVNATDAQGFRTHESYRAILDMMGQWTPIMEDALNKMIKGEWDMSHFNVVWQTIKPFLFSTTIKPDGLGDIMKVNHQNKDSEFLLLAVMDMIAADANSPQIKVLNQFMLDNNIDLALYESGCKAGKQGVIDLNYNQAKIAECKKEGSIRVGERVFNLHTDKWNPKLSNFDNFKNQLDEYLDNGTMLQEEYNKIFEEYLPLTEDEMRQVLEESVKTKESQDPRFNRGERPTEDAWFNPNVVHTFSYEDYMIAQPTPEHLIDAETIFGSQFRNLIISDLPADFECTINGIKYNRKEVHDLYNSLIVANLVDSFNRIKGDFNNIHTIQQRLLSMVQGNPKYGRDIIQALEIVKVVNPLTGQEEEVFNIPLNNPSTTEKLQQLILSAFKNGITKQYIHGGNAILVSDIGYTKELNVVKEKDGTLVGVQCYLPATSKAFFEPLLKTVTNTETGEAYQILDFNELDDDLKRAIGYRIPTEQKYSMVPLIIKGFLPQQNGSSIMVAEDVTTLSGCDYDVDKMFLMLYNFVFDEFGNPKKLKPRKPAIGKYKNDADAVAISKMSKEERDNLIIDLSNAILTHPDMAWVSSKPGSYDNLKRASRVAQILENQEMFEQFKTQYGVTTSAEINSKFKELPLLEDETDAEGNVITQSLENFVKEHKATINPLELTTFKYFHRQNMTGGALVGIYANNTTMQAKYQETHLWLKEADKLKINDTDYTSLTSIYSKDDKLISFNCAETSAASVDNGKDPVLADLMQNKKTAKVLGMLLRAGVPIDDATMVFNLPNVREVIYHTGSLDVLKYRVSTLYTALKDVLGKNLGENSYDYIDSTKNNNIDSAEIIDFIVEYRSKASKIYTILLDDQMSDDSKRIALVKAGFTLEEVKEFVKKDLDYSIIVNHYHTVSKDLGEVTRVSRADSPNGAIKNTIQEAVIQKRDVDLLHMSYKRTTIQGLHNVIRNDFITGNESVEEMIEMFINHGTPRLQAFYTFGIDLPLNMISKYFVQTNPWMTEKTNELFDQSFVSFGSKDNGKLDPKLLKYFYNGMMHYCLSSSSLFGTDSSMTFEEKRDWYIYEFPKEFINLRNKYTQLNNHSIVGRLEVRKGVIEMLRAGRLTETQRIQLANSITSLLQGNEIERQLATDLLIYAYHSTGLNFGPNNYGMFFDTTFYNQFPEFVEILRTMQFKVNEESGLMKNFMDQFYAIYGNLFTFKVYSGKNLVIDDSTKRISIDKDMVVNVNIQQQKGTKEPWKYITAVYKVKETNDAGEVIEVPKRVLFKLVDGDSAENATYERVGTIYDPFTGHIRYNANRTAEQLSIDVNSEGALKKAEEQRNVNYKRGAKYEYKGRPINDKNAVDNAFAFLESDSALEVPDYFDSIPDVGDAEYDKLEASAKELDKLNLEETIADELDRDYSDDENGIHMLEDYGDFLDGLSDISAENLEVLERLDEKQLSVLDNIESYMDSIPEQDYGIEEGLNELEEKMC